MTTMIKNTATKVTFDLVALEQFGLILKAQKIDKRTFYLTGEKKVLILIILLTLISI